MLAVDQHEAIPVHDHVPRNEIPVVDSGYETVSEFGHAVAESGQIPFGNLGCPGFDPLHEGGGIFPNSGEFPIAVKIECFGIEGKQEEVAIGDFWQSASQIGIFFAALILHERAGKKFAYVIGPSVPRSGAENFWDTKTRFSRLFEDAG